MTWHLAAGLWLLCAATTHGAERSEVIVHGSTPGGFCAAIAAAREGASVILLEPTDHVGAMSTDRLSHCDSNQMARRTVMGLFDEWHRRLVKDYTDRGLEPPYNAGVKDQSRAFQRIPYGLNEPFRRAIKAITGEETYYRWGQL